MRTDNKGLNLVELLVVVAIASALALLAIPQFERMREAANMENITQMMSDIDHKLKSIHLDHNPNQYPPASVMPNELGTWVAPTSLQDVEDLMGSFKKLCNDGTKGTGRSGGSPMMIPGAGGFYNCVYRAYSGKVCIEPPDPDSKTSSVIAAYDCSEMPEEPAEEEKKS